VSERLNGREVGGLRDIQIVPNFLEVPLGSALISCGSTRVICAASVEEKVPGWMVGNGRGWVTAEYNMMPACTAPRFGREGRRGKVGGRTQEIQRLIGRSLRAAIDMEALGERTIWIDCDVMQADGGTRTASITGAYVALAIALGRLKASGLLQADPLVRPISAVSIGIVDGEVLTDLDYSEDSRAGVDMNVVMGSSGELIEVQGTAEGAPFGRDDLNRMLDAASSAGAILFRKQEEAIAKGLSS
jgi:ribonuclease PH